MFKVDQQEHIVNVILDSPPANTWTLSSLSSFCQFLQDLNKDRKITALILKSANQKFFSAGADLKSFNNISSQDAEPMTNAFGKAFETLSTLSAVTIAVIEGYALGGGLEVALACDIRLVNYNATLGLPEAKVGLLPCAGGTQNLTALVGEGWAKRIILCGETVNGQQAQQIGLAEEATEKPENLAQKMAKLTTNASPDSLIACKKLIQMGRHQPRWHNLTQERQYFLELFKGKNQQEGVQAFLEKRQPKWQY